MHASPGKMKMDSGLVINVLSPKRCVHVSKMRGSQIPSKRLHDLVRYLQNRPLEFGRKLGTGHGDTELSFAVVQHRPQNPFHPIDLHFRRARHHDFTVACRKPGRSVSVVFSKHRS